MMRDIFFSYMAHGGPSCRGAGKACSNYNRQKEFLCITWKGRILLYKDQGLCMRVGIIVMNSPCIAISTQFPFFLIISYYYYYCYYIVIIITIIITILIIIIITIAIIIHFHYHCFNLLLTVT